MNDKESFWLTGWGMMVIAIVVPFLIALCYVGGVWGIWQWEKSNYQEYCEARGLTYREAGERLWCE